MTSAPISLSPILYISRGFYRLCLFLCLGVLSAGVVSADLLPVEVLLSLVLGTLIVGAGEMVMV